MQCSSSRSESRSLVQKLMCAHRLSQGLGMRLNERFDKTCCHRCVGRLRSEEGRSAPDFASAQAICVRGLPTETVRIAVHQARLSTIRRLAKECCICRIPAVRVLPAIPPQFRLPQTLIEFDTHAELQRQKAAPPVSHSGRRRAYDLPKLLHSRRQVHLGENMGGAGRQGSPSSQIG